MRRLKRSIVMMIVALLLGSLFVMPAHALKQSDVHSYKVVYNSKKDELFAVFEVNQPNEEGSYYVLIGMHFSMEGKPIGDPVILSDGDVGSYDVVYHEAVNRYLVAWAGMSSGDEYLMKVHLLNGDNLSDVRTPVSISGSGNSYGSPVVAVLEQGEGAQGIYGLAYIMDKDMDAGQEIVLSLFDENGIALTQPIHETTQQGEEVISLKVVADQADVADPEDDGFYVVWNQEMPGRYSLFGKHVFYSLQEGTPELAFNNNPVDFGTLDENWSYDLAVSPSGIGVAWGNDQDQLTVAKVVYGASETKSKVFDMPVTGRTEKVSLLYVDGNPDGEFAINWTILSETQLESYTVGYLVRLTDDLDSLDDFKPLLPFDHLLDANGAKGIVVWPAGLAIVDLYGNLDDWAWPGNFYEPVISPVGQEDFLVVSYDTYWDMEANQKKFLRAHLLDADGKVKDEQVLDDSYYDGHAVAYGNGKHLVVWSTENDGLWGAYLSVGVSGGSDAISVEKFQLSNESIHKFAIAPLTGGSFLLVYQSGNNIVAAVIQEDNIIMGQNSEIAPGVGLDQSDHPLVLTPIGDTDQWLLIWEKNHEVFVQHFTFDAGGVQKIGDLSRYFIEEDESIDRIQVAHDPLENRTIIGILTSEQLLLNEIEFDEYNNTWDHGYQSGFSLSEDAYGFADLVMFYDPGSKDVQVLWTEEWEGKPVILQQAESTLRLREINPDIRWRIETGFWDSFVRMTGTWHGDHFTLFYVALEDASDMTAEYGFVPLVPIESVLRSMGDNSENRITIRHIAKFLSDDGYAHMEVSLAKLLESIEPINPVYVDQEP